MGTTTTKKNLPATDPDLLLLLYHSKKKNNASKLYKLEKSFYFKTFEKYNKTKKVESCEIMYTKQCFL